MSNQTNKAFNQPKTLADKAFFASYLNMARHNAYISLSHITEIIGHTPAAEDQLANMACITVLNQSKEPEKAQKAIRLLRDHFPFLRFYYDAETKRLDKNEQIIDERKCYFDILTKLLGQLNRFRNEFTHAEEVAIDFTDRRNLFFDLDRVFEVAVRRIVEIRNFKEDEVEHLRKFSGLERVNGKPKPKPNPKFKHAFLQPNKDAFTEAGLAFYTCLFLEKAYAYKFLKQLKGFKAGNTPQYRATTEAFAIFHINLPKLRINHTVSSPTSLALDMFNDLKKCPKNLFELLSPIDNETFRVEREELSETDSDDLLEDVNLVRYNDRFPFFALQYIDQNHLFQNLRFHIDMGNYIHKVYAKNAIDGEERTRRLTKSLKTFGRLQDMNAQRLQLWQHIIKDKPKQDDTAIYMTDTYPHYHIEANNIGIKLTPQQLPALPQQPPPKNEKPDFWLSVYELPAMLFLLLLENKPNQRSYVEQLLTNYRSNVHTLLKNAASIKQQHLSKEALAVLVKEKYHFDINDLPTELLQYLNSKEADNKISQAFKEHAALKIEKLIQESTKRLARIDNDLEAKEKGMDKKPGKKGWTEIKSGTMGDFLAKDMLWLQPSLDGKGKDKLTGQNFQILQASLAFYGRDKHLLTDIFKACKLIDSDNAHPFLKDIQLERHDNIISFYQIYLWKRIKYFEKCEREQQYSQYYFLKPNATKWKNRFYKYDTKSLEDKEKGLLHYPLNIPRGFFKDALVQWFKQHGTPQMQAVANSPRVNAIYLIQQYFALERHQDGSQPFYSYLRSYQFINKLYGEREGNSKFKPLIAKYYDTTSPAFKQLMKEVLPDKIQHMRVEKGKDLATAQNNMYKALSHCKQNEKTIRLNKAEDMLLFLMAKNMLFTNVAANVQAKMDDSVFRLQNIQPQANDNNDTTTLSLQLPFELAYEVYAMDEKNEKKLAPLHTITIHQPKLKAKNYGDFVRFTKDRRLNNLFRWLPASTRVERSELQKELDSYDKHRITVFELVQQFEVLSTQKLGTSNEGTSLFDKILTAFYTAYPAYAAEQLLVKSIRNAFSHNQYPVPDNFETVEGLAIPNIAAHITQTAQQIFTKYIAMLNNHATN